MSERDYVLFSGTSNRPLATAVSNRLRSHSPSMWKVGEADIERFSDGETRVNLLTHVRDTDVYLFQSTSNPANDHLMELMILADAAVRSAAHKVTAVIPYFGYARQDRRPDFTRVPITARVVAEMLQGVGVRQVVTCDLHNQAIQGFFNIPVINASSIPLFTADIFNQFDGAHEVCIVSPDTGGVPRARALGKALNNDKLAIIDKRRPKANVSEVMNIIGDVEGRVCVIFDDMVDTAGTLCKAAKALKGAGALEVHAYATHGVLSGPALENVKNTTELDSLVVTDTIQVRANPPINKIRIVSIVDLLTETIHRVSTGSSISALYDLAS